jgi:hypothetical protein
MQTTQARTPVPLIKLKKDSLLNINDKKVRLVVTSP